MTAYPHAPEGWIAAGRRRVGPFTTHVTFRTPGGSTHEWASRRHRKGGRGRGCWWAPRRLSWWIGVLFAIGSACFFVGPFPGFVELVGSAADGAVFFVGSIFFTTAAALQWLEVVNVPRGPAHARGRFRVASFEPRRIDWWAAGIQLVGTVFFNVNAFRALQSGLDAQAYDRLVWTPDAVGCACFLVSSGLAYAEIGGRDRRRTIEWRIAALNLVGSVFFGISAIAAFWVPSQGSVVDLAWANAFTALGGLCFLLGALLLLPEGAAEDAAPAASPAAAAG